MSDIDAEAAHAVLRYLLGITPPADDEAKRAVQHLAKAAGLDAAAVEEAWPHVIVCAAVTT